MLLLCSLCRLADRIKKPLLLIHGEVRGTVVLSICTAALWGFHDSGQQIL